MTSNAVPGFLPSVRGFPFPNAWPPGPTVRFGPFDPRVLGFGDASAGLCGGMVLTVRDLFEANLAAPTGPQPENGSPRFASIVRRQVELLDWFRVPLRYYDLQALHPDAPGGLFGLIPRDPPRVIAVREEWPKIRADIDAGHAPVLGLIRASGLSPWDLTHNHQVLAFGYDDTPGAIRIRLYDPNHPGDDGVEIRADVGPDASGPWRDRIHLAQSTGEPLLGFFRHPYRPPQALSAWR